MIIWVPQLRKDWPISSDKYIHEVDGIPEDQ